MKKFLNKPFVKHFILSLLNIGVGLIGSSMGLWDKNADVYFVYKLIALIVLVILDMVAIALYGVEDYNERKEAKLLREENENYGRLLSSLMTECKFSANGTNKVIHSIIEDSNANLKLWNFEDECTRLVEHIYTLVQKLGVGSDFEILYDRLIEDGQADEEIATIAFANKKKIKPSVYRKKRKLNEVGSDTEIYHDIDLFKKKSADFEILMDSKEIDEVFGYKTKEQRAKNKNKYSQYIAIPVFCNEDKMIGLIEVVCFNKSKLGDDREEIDDIICRFINPYSYLALVSHKMEKALIAKPNL